MAGAQSQHRLGIALVVIAAVAFSTAPFFTRLLPYDSWTILFWRGLFGGSLITVIMVLLQGRAGLRDFGAIDNQRRVLDHASIAHNQPRAFVRRDGAPGNRLIPTTYTAHEPNERNPITNHDRGHRWCSAHR